METLKLLTALHAKVTAEMQSADAFYLAAIGGGRLEGYFDGKAVAYNHMAYLLENLIADLKEGLTS